MDIDYNKELHSKLLRSLAALSEYDKVKRWDDEMKEEVAVLLKRMEQCMEKELLYYELHRKINISD
jgi:hypothetical protein